MRYNIIFFIALIGLLLVGCVESRDPETLTIALNPSVDTIEVGSTYEDLGATATLEGNEYNVNVVENTVDTTRVGSYRIVYETSYRTVTRRVVRKVDVIDTTPPVITLKPGIDTVLVDTEWIDAGVEVTDNSGLDVEVEVQGDVVISMPGEYRITYIAVDAFGNRSEMVRSVFVVEEE